MKKSALIIYGPTAAGKTDLAISLAKKYNGEIISADSRQVYKGLDIGTGKVSFGSEIEKYANCWLVDGVKVYGFDLVEPGQKFTVADFLKFAQESTEKIIAEKKLPIIVGGTGFYIKSFLYGLPSIGIEEDPKLREDLAKLSIDELYQKLKEINPQKSQSLNESDRKNPRRLIRAIEISMSKSPLKPKSTTYNLKTTNYLLICLTAPNEYLYTKVDKWVEKRVEKGMIQEVEELIKRGIEPNWLENLGLEYRWITKYVKGDIQKEEAIKRLKGDIHNFVRRQKSWFKQFKNIKLYDISQKNWRLILEKDISNWHKSL